jgi:hypothetical protein
VVKRGEFEVKCEVAVEGTFFMNKFLLGFTSALLENTLFNILVYGFLVKNFLVDEVIGCYPNAAVTDDGNGCSGSSCMQRSAPDVVDIVAID